MCWVGYNYPLADAVLQQSESELKVLLYFVSTTMQRVTLGGEEMTHTNRFYPHFWADSHDVCSS